MRSRIISFLYATGLVRPAYLALTLLRVFHPRSLVRSLRFIFKGSPDRLPIPPFWLRAQVAGTIDAGAFYRRGMKDVDTISAILLRRDIDIRNLSAVLDFGCGCGRGDSTLTIQDTSRAFRYRPKRKAHHLVQAESPFRHVWDQSTGAASGLSRWKVRLHLRPFRLYPSTRSASSNVDG